MADMVIQSYHNGPSPNTPPPLRSIYVHNYLDNIKTYTFTSKMILLRFQFFFCRASISIELVGISFNAINAYARSTFALTGS